MSTSEAVVPLDGEPRNRLSTDSALAYQVRAELILMVGRGSLANLTSGIGAALLLAIAALYGDDDYDRFLRVAMWLGVITLGLLSGMILSRLLVRGPRDNLARTHRLGRWFAINGAMCAVVWGSASWVMLPGPDLKNELFVQVGTAMVLMGGAGANAAYRPLVNKFIFCLCAVFVAGLVRLQDPFHLLYAAAFVLLGLVTLMYSRNQERALCNQVVLGIERKELIEAAQRERKAAEGARARAEDAKRDSDDARKEAELANRAKTVFLTSASHDMRQPMHALGVYVDYLKRNAEDPDLAKTARLCERSLDALRDQLNTMLDVSKIAAGTIQPEFATAQMTTLLDRLDAQTRPLAEDKHLYFEVERSEVLVHTDVELLERILVNLTLNAIRYTSAGRVVVRCKRRANVLRCHVYDTGIGIPREELRNIYEPFYQVANAARDRRKGLGMGLAIVQQLCDLLKYKIRVRSVQGKGSVFAVDVPLAEAGATVPDTLLPEPERDFVRGAFVLVVEDDRDSREATAHMLRGFGCRVLCASSGSSAISKLQGKEIPPDLILADYRLDGETGIDVVRIVSDNLRAAFGEDFWVPALVVSGDTSKDVLQEVSNEGFAMLHKPVAPDDLRRVMNAKLGAKSREAAV